MGILLVYDVTDEASSNSTLTLLPCPSFLIYIASICQDIRNWIRNIEQHASNNVNKADMDESKR
ncbi:ras-related protein RABE1c-like, partial [Sesbania bispinosa]